jgi:hypothetical protein
MCRIRTDSPNFCSLSLPCLLVAKLAVTVLCTVTATAVGPVLDLYDFLFCRTDASWRVLLKLI